VKLFVMVGEIGDPPAIRFRQDYDTNNKTLDFHDVDPRVRALEYALKAMKKNVEAAG
jgi:hypothetical protein